MPTSRISWARRVLGAGAQAFVPFGGPALRRHFDNFESLDFSFPALRPPGANARIFVLAPHPDDETLGAGGLIIQARTQGAAVRIGWLSSGDGSRTTQISQIVRGQSQKSQLEIARLRQSEALGAAKILGVEPTDTLFFGFPDGGAGAIWNGDYSVDSPFVSPFTAQNRVETPSAFAPGSPFCRAAMLENLVLAFQEWEPTLVLTTHPRDTNSDHVAAYHLCRAAIEVLPARKRPQLLTFLIHCGIWPVPNGFHPALPLSPPLHLARGGTKWTSLALSSPEIARKKAALECHQTQLGSTPRYLHSFVRCNELFGEIS